MIHDSQTLTTDVETPAPPRSGAGDGDIVSWLTTLLGPRPGGGWPPFFF